MHMPPRSQWGDRFELWHAGSYHRHNHPRQIFCQSVQGSWSYDLQNVAIYIRLAGRSYHCVSTAVLYCDERKHSDMRYTRLLLCYSDFTKFNFRRGSAAKPAGETYDTPLYCLPPRCLRRLARTLKMNCAYRTRWKVSLPLMLSNFRAPDL